MSCGRRITSSTRFRPAIVPDERRRSGVVLPMIRKSLALPLFLLLVLLFPGAGLTAAESRRMSLREAVSAALMNNLDFEIEEENLNLKRSALLQEEANFDPSFYLDVRADKAIRGSTSLIEAGALSGTGLITQDNQRMTTGLKQRFGWGGNYELSLGQVRSVSVLQSVNPAFYASAMLTFTQPLLKGRGRWIAGGPVRVAQNQFAMTEMGLRARVMAILEEVIIAYWDLVFGLENLLIQQQALKSAQQLLEVNRKKVEIGLLAPIEILVAESGIASRQEEVIIGKKGAQDAQDNLMRLLNFDEGGIIPRDLPIETPPDFQEESLLSLALTGRPEIQQSHLELQNKGLLFRIAEYNRRPALDLVGSVGRTGIGKNRPDEISRIFSGRFYQWEAGVILTYPFGNQAALAQEKREKAELNKAHLVHAKMMRQVAQEVREGIRRVQTDFQRIETTKAARRLSEKKGSAGTERFQLGLISSHDLLEFQDDFARAKGRELKAVVDYNKSLAHLERVTGNLLESYTMKIME